MRAVEREYVCACVWCLGCAGKTFVPVKAEPLEVADHRFFAFASGARGVSVLHPQHKLSTRAARIEPVEQRSAGAAHVQVAGRGGREANAHLRRERLNC
jgi:hypothetical protein